MGAKLSVLGLIMLFSFIWGLRWYGFPWTKERYNRIQSMNITYKIRFGLLIALCFILLGDNSSGLILCSAHRFWPFLETQFKYQREGQYFSILSTAWVPTAYALRRTSTSNFHSAPALPPSPPSAAKWPWPRPWTSCKHWLNVWGVVNIVVISLI